MEYILPLASSSISSTSKVSDVDEVAWTDRLLQTMKYLEEKSINAVLSLTGLKHMYVHDTLFATSVPFLTSYFRRPNVYDHFVTACISNNVCECIFTYTGNPSHIRSQGGIIDEDEDAVIHKLNTFIQYIAG